MNGGYVRMWSGQLSLDHYDRNAIDDDFWAYNSSTLSNTIQSFIESGIVVGTFCGTENSTGNCTQMVGPYQRPRYFWGDSRYGDGLHEHVDIDSSDYPPNAPDVLNTYHDNHIKWVSTDTWSVRSGPWSGTSTSNPLHNDLLVTGTEEVNQSGTAHACNGQSGIQWFGTDGSKHDGWPGAYDAYYNYPYLPGHPPYVNNVASGEWHDWAPNSTTSCYGSATSFLRAHAHRTKIFKSFRSASGSAPLSESEIQSIALAFSASCGDPFPTSIQYVESARNQAVLLSSDDVVPDTRDAFLIVIQGSNFVDENLPRAPGSPAQTGSVLTLVVDAQTGELTDVGIQDSVPDLSTLGHVTIVR